MDSERPAKRLKSSTTYQPQPALPEYTAPWPPPLFAAGQPPVIQSYVPWTLPQTPHVFPYSPDEPHYSGWALHSSLAAPAPTPNYSDQSLLPSTSHQRQGQVSAPSATGNRLERAQGRSKDDVPDKGIQKTILVSPFQDCLDSFGTLPSLQFNRPNNGFVNGYVKFRWTSKPSGQSSPIAPAAGPALLSGNGNVGQPDSSSDSSEVRVYSPTNTDFSRSFASTSSGVHNVLSESSPGRWTPTSSAQTSPNLSPQSQSLALVTQKNTSPRFLPPHFGHQAKMEIMDRRFWEFYIMNWCPGRSVLKGTNLWLTDFAKMQESDGVRSAIQSLAGVYIYDYLPESQRTVSTRLNELFRVAENRLTELMNHPEGLDEARGNEVITITVILSMQDIILTERRLKKPNRPRWLKGFLYGEHALAVTDPGSRFWRASNVQLTSLRVSQSIMVGRAVILSQPMDPLLGPEKFDAQAEAARFGWLLYGTESEMYEIHGGCGFSKKLLHILSQVTYCAGRLQQDPDSIVATTVQFLHTEISELRQWCSEFSNWEMAKASPPVLQWVREKPEGFVIDHSYDMTDVTAEAWRLAILIYLQCRGLRLPRNHPEVINNMSELALCIRIMPTSGSHFTAQAPLFPVFLLGLLAVTPEHKEESRSWFERVVQTPVRSSVPPLFEALKRIWMWVDKEIPIQSIDHLEPFIGGRPAWWERLVARVQEKEIETLCLT